MTLSDVENVFARVGVIPVEKTFKELSKSDAEPARIRYGVNAGGYCELLSGVYFDDVTRRFYERIPHTVASPDALYVWNNEIYLIEFKTGSAPVEDVYRKFYDACVLLVDAGVMSFDECRDNVVGVLVWTDADHAGNHALPYDLPGTMRTASAPRYEYMVPQDLHRMTANTDFRILSSYLMKKVYVLTPTDFDIFGSEQGWR